MTPAIRTSSVSDEEYEEWLGRLEEEEMLPDEYNLFQETLKSELYGYNDAQIDALWEHKQTFDVYAEHGIQPLGTREDWGYYQRYAVQGMIGLWGYDSIQQIREEEGW